MNLQAALFRKPIAARTCEGSIAPEAHEAAAEATCRGVRAGPERFAFDAFDDQLQQPSAL